MQAAAQQGAGFVAARGRQHLHLHAKALGQLVSGDVVQKGVFFLPQHHGGHAQRAAGQLALALSNDIGRRYKPGHTHIAAEEFVLDGVHRHLDHGVLAVQLSHHLVDERRSHFARDHVHLFGAVNAVGLFQLRQKFRGIQAHHAHAVFQLVEVLVELFRRDGPACLEVPFITGINDALAVAALALIAEFFHDVDDLGTCFCIIRCLLEQLLAVVRHTAGHRSDALHHRGQLQKVGEGTAQLVAVVDAAAQHQLTVDGDAALHQTGQILEHLAAALVGQHPHTELRVRGVH